MPLTMPRRRPILLSTTVSLGTVLVLVLVGCGSNPTSSASSSSGGGAGGCESSGARMCERACECGTECKTAHAAKSGGMTTLSWDSVEDCKAGYVGLACRDGGPPGVDFAACLSAVSAASCAGDAFLVPAICDPPKDGG